MNGLVIVRGGGDIASGTIYKLKKCGFSVLILETGNPSAIRRNVAFSEAVYQGSQTIEDMTCYLADSREQAREFLQEGRLTVLVDPFADCLEYFRAAEGPELIAVIDAVLAKKNLGTTMDMAPITIALGPGFNAGKDCDVVIETMRGHQLGRLIHDGYAMANTGIPGNIKGFTSERVIHSPAEGILRNIRSIADTVRKGEDIAYIETPDGNVYVKATLDGLLRGLIRDGFPVTEGFKIADIDPRPDEYENCFTVSDKARCIAGGVLEALLERMNELDISG
ncbi:MAG: EF2563 family selenium-dependent molybdenum hydroxylase system protein [Parasporobacterium sp.]|nr:EF2563 family selenium-dependent molybdenum hydroxylase system protein [Parasporobacterium sp.]